MAQTSRSFIRRLGQRLLTLLGLAAATATTVHAAPLPERQKLEARVAQARQALHAADRAQTGGDTKPHTLLAQANNWNNWPNWSNWANWANG